MESHIEQEESDSSRASADLRIRKTQVFNLLLCCNLFLFKFCHFIKIYEKQSVYFSLFIKLILSDNK